MADCPNHRDAPWEGRFSPGGYCESSYRNLQEAYSKVGPACTT